MSWFNDSKCRLATALIFSLLVLQACSFHSYNPDSPEDYANFWCAEHNTRSSLLYSAAQSAGEVHRPEDKVSCMKEYTDRVPREIDVAHNNK